MRGLASERRRPAARHGKVYAAPHVGTSRDTTLLLALVCSGCAALGYEIVWTRLCTPMLGSETLGVLATLAGFFGGMALGAAVLHRRAVAGPDPLGLFVRLELAAAGFALVSPWLLHALGRAIPAWLGPWAGDNQGTTPLVLAIAVAALLMIPGTLCMGATLAAVTEARRRACAGDDDGRGVGRLYAANTLGAMVGVLLSVHVVLPALGLAGAALLLAAIGTLAALLARTWGRANPGGPDPAGMRAGNELDASRDPDPDAREPLPLLVLVGGAGLMGVGFEVIGVLVLSQVFENTIYTFADVLAVYLGGTATGAALWGTYGPRLSRSRPSTTAAVLLFALALAVALSAFAIAGAPGIVEAIAPEGAGFGQHLVAEAVVALVVFGPATLLMGALFSHAMGLVAPGGIGRAYAINTLGGAVAPFVFGVWGPATFGYRDGFYLVAWGYLVVFGAFTWFRRFAPKHQIAAIVAVIAATSLAPRSLVIVEPDPGWTTIAEHQSAMGLVIVSERKADEQRKGSVAERRLQIGKHFRMGGRAAFGERRMGHLPLLLHGAPTRALFLGIGTGATLSAVRSFDSLVAVDAVEIVPAVISELDEFDAISGKIREDPRITFHAADARRFVAAGREPYDVVVADLFHPGLDGAGSLYAREHFAAIADRLAQGGVFVQWLPVYQLDEVTLRTIVATFLDVFPRSEAWLGHYNAHTPALALVALQADAPVGIDVARLVGTLRAPVYVELLMNDPRDLLAGHVLDRAALERFAAEAPINSDLSPHVMLDAPRVAYEGMAHHGAENLLLALDGRTPLPLERLSAEAPVREQLHAEVLRFGDALDRYLHAEIELELSGGAPPSESVIAAYLRAYALAPDFVATRGKLYELVGTSPALAERILPEMLAATPDEPRVWKTWITYLRRIDDRERLAEAESEAQARFGTPESLAP